jgi:hypothetical protein
MIVPTLRVGMQARRSASTRSVNRCVTTRSVGTISLIVLLLILLFYINGPDTAKRDLGAG